MVGFVRHAAARGVARAVCAGPRDSGEAVDARSRWRGEAAAERFVQSEVDDATLADEGVVVAALPRLDPAAARGVDKGVLRRVAVFAAAEGLEAQLFLGVAEGVQVPD